MLAIHATCLLALISSGFCFLDGYPLNSKQMRLSASKNNYGFSTGFKIANIKDYPFLASVVSVPNIFPTGAAAILNKHWVLFTAFAIALVPQEVNIYVGTNYAGRSGQRLNVSKIIPHEKFSQQKGFCYNIAVLKTVQPIPFSDKAKPVKLGNSPPKTGTECTLLSYGYVQDPPTLGWDLGVATVQVKPQQECAKEHGTLKMAYCAAADGVETCYGDLGDPLMYKGKLVGFNIGGDFCNMTHKYEVYTNVPAMKKWVWKTIKKNSNDDEMEGLSESQFFAD